MLYQSKYEFYFINYFYLLIYLFCIGGAQSKIAYGTNRGWVGPGMKNLFHYAETLVKYKVLHYTKLVILWHPLAPLFLTV